MGDLASYEVYAVQYAYRPDRPRSETFVSNAWTDPMHDTLQPIGYFVWAIVGSDRTVVVDTGFDADEAERRRAGSGDRWRPELACTPAEGLSMIAIDALAVKDVIITHLHFDHAGTLSHFPAARFHLQELEMRYATGPHMGHDYFSGAYTIDHVIDMVGHVYQGRVVFHQGDAEIPPGVSVHHVGGHTMGMQFVRVRTKRGYANGDPSVKRAVSDAVMERAAVELKGRLRELASSLHPFPRFLSASDVQAVEVEPSGVPDPESGRIVVSRRRAV